jgi:hypothetical protein
MASDISKCAREPSLAAFSSLDRVLRATDAEESFAALARSPFYEDRFAVWSARTQSALKQKRSKDPREREPVDGDARRQRNTAQAMRMVQLLGEKLAR